MIARKVVLVSWLLVILYTQSGFVGLITPSRGEKHARVAAVKICPVPRLFCQSSKPCRNKDLKSLQRD